MPPRKSSSDGSWGPSVGARRVPQKCPQKAAWMHGLGRRVPKRIPGRPQGRMVSGEECPRGLAKGRMGAWSRAKSAQECPQKAVWAHSLGRRVPQSVPKKPYWRVVSGEECPRVQPEGRVGGRCMSQKCPQKAVWAHDLGRRVPKRVPGRPQGRMVSGKGCPRGFPKGRMGAWSQAKSAQGCPQKGVWAHGLGRRVIQSVSRRP